MPAPRSSPLPPLLRAAHLGPTAAVTAIVAVLAVALDVPSTRAVLLTAAVLAGQLTVGWGNDWIDAPRDREVGRPDKPLATGELEPGLVLRCVALAAAACVVLSLLTGWRPAVAHLVGVAFGHLYNLRLKSTPWSWLPYGVAFALLPVAVSLAGDPHEWPPAWMVGTAAMLGVGAHFLNALPDLDDDAVTGVRGLPHRFGPVWSRLVATGLLVLASVVAVLGPPGSPPAWAWGALVLVVALAAVALLGRGRLPFQAAIAIALLDVVLLAVVAA